MYFAVKGDVSPGSTATNWTVNTTILGDTVQTGQTPGYNAATSSGVTPGNFNWSDNASTTPTVNDVDWFNGFGVSGLPASGL